MCLCDSPRHFIPRYMGDIRGRYWIHQRGGGVYTIKWRVKHRESEHQGLENEIKGLYTEWFCRVEN